jgi:hypothetical protein
VTVAAIIAVLTGVVVGALSARASCTPVLVDTAVTPAPAPTVVVPTASPAAGLGGSNAEPVRPAPSSPAAEAVQPVRKGAVCGNRPLFEALPALAAVGGAGLAGLAVLVLVLASAAMAGGVGAGGVAAGGLAPQRPVPGRGPRPGGPPVPAQISPAAPPAPPGAVPAGVAPGAVPAGVAPVSGPQRRTEADRAVLVRACIYVRDRITSKALADRLGAALQEAGVSAVEPAGERFDPAHHEAGAATPSDDPGKVGTIAAVEVPGYRDRGRVLRAPVVTVYQASGKRPGPRHAEQEDQ